MAEIVEPLQVMVEDHMHEALQRIAQVASNRDLPNRARTDNYVRRWHIASDSLALALTLYHPQSSSEVIFPEASLG